jgi:hypothetical protein
MKLGFPGRYGDGDVGSTGQELADSIVSSFASFISITIAG